MKAITLPSFAKLNLYLKITGKRKDNYHDLITIFERVSLYDTIRVVLRDDPVIKIFSRCNDIPLDSTNLCFKAAKIIQDRYRVNRGVSINITKRIPVGAGLGGGSSNAAAVLLALNKLWGLGLTQEELLELAAHIGCDVPFFILDKPFALGQKRGDKVSSIPGLKNTRLWHLILAPTLNIPTPQIYSDWDKLYQPKAELTKLKKDVKLILSSLKYGALPEAVRLFDNDLERVTLRSYPQLKSIKLELERLGLLGVLMSGSGPAFFTTMASKKEAMSYYQRLQLFRNQWRVFLVSTC